MEYDSERERRARIEEVELGRKYQTASEVLSEIMSEQRENIIRQLESRDFDQQDDALGLVLYLRVLKICENLIQSKIDAGNLAREELINDGDKVVLDFTGVNVVSNSFADECIAKLLLEMPLEELKRRTTFRGLNPLAGRSVLVALQRRYKVMKEAL